MYIILIYSKCKCHKLHSACISTTSKLIFTDKVSLANISWMAGQIYMIELALESAHQTVSDNI